MAQRKLSESSKVIDRHVGMKLRLLRLNAKMSQTGLGNKLGLTFQQIQKYERGANRIGGSRLWQICEIFNAEPNFFFDGLGGRLSQDKIGTDRSLLSRQNHRLLQSFDSIKSQSTKNAVEAVVSSLTS